MTTPASKPILPTVEALDQLNRCFWLQAIENVEAALAVEDEPPLKRVALLKRMVPAPAENLAQAASGSDTSQFEVTLP